MQRFNAVIEIIGINPFVHLPERILKAIFKQAGREKGYIPVSGSIKDIPYKQTLVKYSGAWRLYINNSMLKNSPKRIGEKISVTVEYDSVTREIKPHPSFVKALNKNKAAKKAFKELSPSRQKEIVRYISNLKMAESVIKNVNKAILHLSGEEKFAGRPAANKAVQK
jgi:hypothetical protein